MTNDTSKTTKNKKNGDNIFAALPKCRNVDLLRNYYHHFLADRTNGRAYATVLRLSVVVCL